MFAHSVSFLVHLLLAEGPITAASDSAPWVPASSREKTQVRTDRRGEKKTEISSQMEERKRKDKTILPDGGENLLPTTSNPGR